MIVNSHNVQLNNLNMSLKGLTNDIREAIALELFKLMEDMPHGMFPYDEDEKQSADPRKIWGKPWHIQKRGAVFLGDRKLAGSDFDGNPPMGEKARTITIAFANVKKRRRKTELAERPKKKGFITKAYEGSDDEIFDYTDWVFRVKGRSPFKYLTEGEIASVANRIAPNIRLRKR